MLITPQPDPGPCSFSRGKGKRWEASCKLENTGYHHQKVGVNVKRSCCFTLKSTFSFCIKNKQKTHHKQTKPKQKQTKQNQNISEQPWKKHFSFCLPISFSAVKNFHIDLLTDLLANSHSLIYKITDRTNRLVCLLPLDLNSRELKQHIFC